MGIDINFKLYILKKCSKYLKKMKMTGFLMQSTSTFKVSAGNSQYRLL